ncbi:MAG: ester cyclase [Chloroflexi bacterium]|nr:ester cyclase [Chloroflexota bacterium]
MQGDENKALVRRFIAEIFEHGRPESVDELCADDFIGHTWGNADKEGLKAAMERVAQGLADAKFVIEDEIGEGERVAIRLTASARHVGEFMGMPASGRSYEIGEIHIFRVRDGKVSEHWHQFDTASLMKQLSGK